MNLPANSCEASGTLNINPSETLYLQTETENLLEVLRSAFRRIDIRALPPCLNNPILSICSEGHLSGDLHVLRHAAGCRNVLRNVFLYAFCHLRRHNHG